MSDNKTLIERIEEHDRKIRAEYQRGYADGGVDMNKKWLITRQEIISDLQQLYDFVKMMYTRFSLTPSQIKNLERIKEAHKLE